MCEIIDGPVCDWQPTTGAIFSPKDVRDYSVACAAAAEFPKEFELDMVRIKNQGAVGSCVAHSLSEVIEYFNSIQKNDETEMSVGYIYGNRTTSFHKGEGMVVRDALKAIQKYGDVPKEKFPYNIEIPKAIEEYEKVDDELYSVGYPYRISTYAKLNNDNEVKNALMKYGPVVMAMDWYNDIRVKDGILTTNCQGAAGGHCMVIYGWNEKGWKVQNSWGRFWGDNGCCIIPYDLEIREKWMVTDNIFDDTDIVKPFDFNFGKIIATILNWILNLF